jgi:hypothetical protein
VSVQIFVEGGGDAKTTLTKCREGFASYCARLAPPKHRPSIVACGGRQQAYDRFKTAVVTSRDDETCVLLVDAEDRVKAATVTEHLRARDGWEFPSLDRHRVFLMAQAMEAWFLADREVLGEFYDGGFLSRSLPGSPTNVETVPKGDLEPRLKSASKPTKTKGEYHKVKHGFALLGLIDPSKVEAGSPHAAEFHEFLRCL